MHLDRWLDIKKKIIDGYELLHQGIEKDPEIRQETEVLEFNGPAGKMRLEWITRPKVLSKKTNYSNRIGGEINVDYVYSEDEQTHTLKVYNWNEARDDWQEIDSANFT
ncbi:MAG: hypothetical protein WCV73_00485 [Patescibacteria group bacterium]|jgi:hypothetical protein